MLSDRRSAEVVFFAHFSDGFHGRGDGPASRAAAALASAASTQAARRSAVRSSLLRSSPSACVGRRAEADRGRSRSFSARGAAGLAFLDDCEADLGRELGLRGDAGGGPFDGGTNTLLGP